jgi:patatin-related protein
MTTSGSEPSPPASETTVSDPGITLGDAAAQAPPEKAVANGPGGGVTERPVSLATQELRLAITLTGGVSLAIWMGGVAREIDLLVQASDRRPEPRAKAAPDPTPATPDPPPATPDDAIRDLYRRLLGLVDVKVIIDVLAGTSAGGINAALLGLVNARGLDLAPLRDIWLEAGSFDRLLRNPREPSPPSLLYGDKQLLESLRTGIGKVIGGTPPPDEARPTDVFITTTLLSPETSRFTDDYGTVIADSDHHGLFHFTQNELCEAGIVTPLSLAARSSASFPAAFEPAFLPFDAKADDRHCAMAAHANTTRPHWVADGGLLVNRPIGPLLQTVFDRPADRQVRRALLYVVPSSAAPRAPGPDSFDKPLSLTEALLRDLKATTNQSIAADLAAIRDHNDRVSSLGGIRLRLAAIGGQLAAATGAPLADADTWADYRLRQGEWLVRPLIAEVMRQLDSIEAGSDIERTLRATAREAITAKWPDVGPQADEDALGSAVALGRPAFDAAKAFVLDLLRSGYVLADSDGDRTSLAELGSRVHAAFPAGRDSDLRAFVRGKLAPGLRGDAVTEVVRKLAKDYAALQGLPDELAAGWQQLAAVAAEARERFRGVLTPVAQAPVPAGDGAATPSLRQRREMAADRVRTYLTYVGDHPGRIVRRLLDLHVAERAMLPVGVDVEQRVELIQVSADTRSLLAPARSTAGSKLTGVQLNHFGAFYKGSWRANDWMWGRLDGAGWLVHVLLDPRRILAVLENDGIGAGGRAEEFYRRLTEVVGTPEPVTGGIGPSRKDLLDELAFLDNEAAPMPTSLPSVALSAAVAIQRQVAAAELGTVAAQMQDTEDPDRKGPDPKAPKPAPTARAWVGQYEAAARIPDPALRVRAVAATLQSCPVPDERFSGETGKPPFLRMASKAAAVATAAATAMPAAPQPLRPAFATARSVTLTAYVAINQTKGSRRMALLAGLALMVLGILAMLTNTVWLGLPGLVLFGAGAVMLAFALWGGVPRIVLGVLTAAVLLLAAAPWLPWLRTTLFDWLTRTAVPYMRDNKWPWTVFFLVILLPPVTMLAAAFRRGRRTPGP